MDRSIRQGENVGNLAFSRVAPRQPLGINPYAYEQKTKPCAEMRDSPLFSGEVKAVEEGGEVALSSGLVNIEATKRPVTWLRMQRLVS